MTEKSDEKTARIAKVVFEADGFVHVYLDDGKELVGLEYVSVGCEAPGLSHVEIRTSIWGGEQ